MDIIVDEDIKGIAEDYNRGCKYTSERASVR